MSNDEVNTGRRRFLVAVTAAMGGIGALFASVPFVSSWFPSARAKAAGAPIEVDISKLKPEERMVVEWRGKPVWIVRRSDAELERLKTETVSLRDPDSAVEQQPAEHGIAKSH